MKNKKVLITSIIVIIGISIAIIFSIKKSEQPFNVTYETEKVSSQTITTSISATGTIEPVTQVTVGTQVSGIIDKIYVDYNSHVHKGQVIAILDRTNLMNELNTAKSNLASAKSDLEYQKANLKRITTLHSKGLISEDEFEIARLSYQKSLQTYKAGLQTVAKAETNLSYATITSPIDGIIISKSVEEGQTVAASFSTPTLFTIAKDLTDMRVIVNVDEADIGEVAEGQRASFTVDAYPNETFEGRVTQVRQDGTTTDKVVTYEVVVSAPNPSLKLKPGLTANVTIFTIEKNQVLSVPSKALRFTPTKETIGPNDKIVDCKGTQKVWVRNGKTFKAYAVQTGISDGVRTEILNGINAGTQIIVDMKSADIDTEDPEQGTRSPFAFGPKKNNKK